MKRRRTSFLPFVPWVAAVTPALVVLAAGAQACGGGEDRVAATVVSPDSGKTTTKPDTGSPLDAGSVVTDDAAIADAGQDAFAWPTCDAITPTATARTIADTWTLGPPAPSETWIAGAYITGISGGGCVASVACQIFLQTDLAPVNLAFAAHRSIKLFASAATASHFVGLKVGDQVDALGWAWRYNVTGQNELLLQVNQNLPGCAKKIGTGTVTPVTGVKLTDLTVFAYENTFGPVLVQVADVSGYYTGVPAETFGLFNTPDAGADAGFIDAGGPSVVSISPYFLVDYKFNPAFASGPPTRFATITGVFGLFIPTVDGGTAPKFVEVYPRTAADIVVR